MPKIIFVHVCKMEEFSLLFFVSILSLQFSASRVPCSFHVEFMAFVQKPNGNKVKTKKMLYTPFAKKLIFTYLITFSCE